MRKRSLGATGIEVTELGLGTLGLGGNGYGYVDPTEAENVVDRAWAMGIRLFDTASSYNNGAVEELLGRKIQGPDGVIVTRWGTDQDQYPHRRDFSRAFFEKQAERSLARFSVAETPARLVVLLHNPSLQAVRGEASQFLKELVEQGKIAAWGVSVGSDEVARAALEQKAQVLSFPYNIFQVSPYRELKKELRTAGVGVLFHSVLAYGLLAGRWGPGHSFPSYDHRAERWPDGAVRTRIHQLNAVRPLVTSEIKTMRAAALRFALFEDLASSVVLGPKTSAQLDQLVREGNIEPPYLSEARLVALEARLSQAGVSR